MNRKQRRQSAKQARRDVRGRPSATGPDKTSPVNPEIQTALAQANQLPQNLLRLFQ